MDKEFYSLLGLEESASGEQVIAAVKKFKEASEKAGQELANARSQQPSLEKFVPRVDFDRALLRAEAAEKQISEEKAASLKKEIDGEIESAMKAGKIAPASVEFYRATCNQESGLKLFRDFVKTAPVVAPDQKVGETKSEVAEPTEQELQIAANCGFTREQYLGFKKAQGK